MICFQLLHRVLSVDPVNPGDKWQVKVQKVDGSEPEQELMFDAVMVCNG